MKRFKINGYIFDRKLNDAGTVGSPGCLQWRSKHVEAGLRLNMLRFERHLMFIKKIKSLFEQFQCGDCRRSFKQTSLLDSHLESCNGGVVTHRWCGGIYEPQKTIKQSLASYGFDVSKHEVFNDTLTFKFFHRDERTQLPR